MTMWALQPHLIVAATTSAGTGPYGSPATIQGIVVNATIQQLFAS